MPNAGKLIDPLRGGKDAPSTACRKKRGKSAFLSRQEGRKDCMSASQSPTDWGGGEVEGLLKDLLTTPRQIKKGESWEETASSFFRTSKIAELKNPTYLEKVYISNIEERKGVRERNLYAL